MDDDLEEERPRSYYHPRDPDDMDIDWETVTEYLYHYYLISKNQAFIIKK